MIIKRNITLITSEIFSALLIEQGITTWREAIKYIQQLPYGRNANREDLSLVITQEKGTCSSKHALLKSIAYENKIKNVKLILCIYKMTIKNTVGIGNHIIASGLPYIPEAHCYLEINGERADFTAPFSSIRRIEDDILYYTEIAPIQVAQWKVDFHKRYVQAWRISEEIEMDFESIWEVREKCILSLSDS